MSEKISFDDMSGWFKLLVLGSPRQNVDMYVKPIDPVRATEEMTVTLKINGIELRVEDFNKVMEEWAERMEIQIKEELDFIRSEEFAKERAKHMLNKAILNLDWDEQ